MKKYLNFKSNYNRFPINEVKGYEHEAFAGYEDIIKEINNLKSGIICFECYPGVDYEELKSNLFNKLNTDKIINIEQYAKPIEEINARIERNLTDDRVFGLMSHDNIEDFYNLDAIKKLQESLVENKESLIIYGFGASLIGKYEKLIYVDMCRWEIQLRYRNKMPNWLMNNYEEDNLKKYKRGFFVEWRVADRLKKRLINEIDYFLDTNTKNDPKMITIDAFNAGIDLISQQPFRLKPYFDPGVWGGQWMKEVCNLDPNVPNYAWSFDGVPEENSVMFKFGNVTVELPSINLVFFRPIKLLGNKVHARFGTEFPIRFDFLDTMSGGNLSLQVHPLTEYIQEKFGMSYTQDESYYILDAKEDAVVYLGVKEGINPNELLDDLYLAASGVKAFDDERFINKFKAKKHDHFLIPAGTIHCSGSNAMVLEISATPYIFTFKLWDWGRVGLDGLPRPIHLNHGEKVIQFDRDTKWVENNLVNQIEKISDYEEKTGLHEREFIETRRYWFDDKIEMTTASSVNMLNLIEGQGAIVESSTNEFEPFTVNYAETFIVPECVKRYTIRPLNANEKCGVIKAYVR